MRYGNAGQGMKYYLFLFILLLPIQVSFALAGSKAVEKQNSTLSSTYWRAEELSGRPVGPGADGKELYMILDDSAKSVNGFSGCNRFSGGFELQGKRLDFGPMAVTMMACVEGMQLELQFLKALKKTEYFVISGEKLLFYDSSNQVLLRFAAVYMR